jgi:hypothetical protein
MGYRSSPIESFKGIRNTVGQRSIENSAVYDASDVSIGDAGDFLQRPGYEKSKALSITSAYSTQEKTAYVVSGWTLNRLDEGLALIPLMASTATEFCDYGKILFTNDGIKVDGEDVVNLVLLPPENPLSLSATEGDMMPGIYRATYTYSRDGLESGSAPEASIELNAVGGISIAPITAPNGQKARVYLTEANGTVFYALDNGVQLNPLNVLADHFPHDTDKVAYFNTRLYVSKPLQSGQSLLYWSQPFHYQLFDWVKDFIVVPGEIRGMVEAESALIVATDSRIYAYDGAVLTTLAEYGCPRGRPICKQPDNTVLIHSDRGVCKALPFQNLTQAKCSLAPGLACSTQTLDMDGISQFVALNDGGGKAYNPYKKPPTI